MDSVALDVVTFMHSMEKFIDFADANGISIPELFEKILEIFRDIPGDDPFDCAARETEILEYLEKLGLYKYENENSKCVELTPATYTVDDLENEYNELKSSGNMNICKSAREVLEAI
jgi:hypothetical protein